ncbi:hypothetical protein V5799_014295 [Amblyomma americanum]|uniref:Uncharacterized protein n=1 Tax=Amblyomma americanum TaxID=6943 RepID=A0AAQ4E3F9_AMBAM
MPSFDSWRSSQVDERVNASLWRWNGADFQVPLHPLLAVSAYENRVLLVVDEHDIFLNFRRFKTCRYLHRVRHCCVTEVGRTKLRLLLRPIAAIRVNEAST